MSEYFLAGLKDGGALMEESGRERALSVAILDFTGMTVTVPHLTKTYRIATSLFLKLFYLHNGSISF